LESPDELSIGTIGAVGPATTVLVLVTVVATAYVVSVWVNVDVTVMVDGMVEVVEKTSVTVDKVCVVVVVVICVAVVVAGAGVTVFVGWEVVRTYTIQSELPAEYKKPQVSHTRMISLGNFVVLVVVGTAPARDVVLTDVVQMTFEYVELPSDKEIPARTVE